MFHTKKQKTAAISVFSNTVLVALKIVAGILSGSVSIISEAIHSGIDLVAAIIAYISVSISGKPADEHHPYGHGKVENVSGVIEGLLIFGAAFLIIKEAAEKIVSPAELHLTGVGIIVMFFSALTNTIVAAKLYKTARETESVALEADALHLKTDVYTSLGVAAGLILIKFTGLVLIDSVIAIVVALLIIKESWHLVSTAFSPLLDARLSTEEEKPLRMALDRFQADNNVKIRFFKTRKSGSQRFVDFHLSLSPETTIQEGTAITNAIRDELARISADIHVHVHFEPEQPSAD